MADFQKTIIYKIFKDDLVYVGSTQDFKRRERGHKSACNNENGKKYNLKLYKTIRKNGGWDDFEVTIVENYPYKNDIEVRMREEYFINKLKACMNSIKAYTDGKCEVSGCDKNTQHPTNFCKKHGGGYRCQESGCDKSAIGTTDFCVKHGGGNRCQKSGCETSSEGTTDFCVKHGGGKRCEAPGCGKSARSTTTFCVNHGVKITCTCGTILAKSSMNKHLKSKKHLEFVEETKNIEDIKQ